MTPRSFLPLYAATALVFFAIDLVWLGVVARGFYQRHLGHLLRAEVLWAPAVLFYALYIAGILVFAVLPGLEARSMARACMALLKDFPLVVVVVDLVWGMVLTASVSAAAYGIGRWLHIP